MRKIYIDYKDVLKLIEIKNISREAKQLAKDHGYLPYMVQRYIDMLGLRETRELLLAFDTLKPRPVIRCNYLKTDCNELIEKLCTLGFDFETLRWCSYCYRVTKTPSSPTIGSTHEYLKGLYYVYKDAPPTIPPLVLDVTKDDIVLDLCAAPGGKATHIAQIQYDQGLVIANDKSRKRIPVLISHVVRLGLKSIVILNYDGRDLPWILPYRFSKTLLDVPCSAEGRIMFDPSRKTKTTLDELAKLVAREIELLISGIYMTKPGGIAVYTTCSIAPEENEFVVTYAKKILESLGIKICIERLNNKWSSGLRSFRDVEFDSDVVNCIRIWPHIHGMEGFFICRIKRIK